MTLGHELKHVSAYMQIQTIRFDGRIRLELDVPEELRQHSIVKIVLQPLVENSIRHGIREKEDASGTIVIRARRDGEALLLQVIDDGVGMDRQTLDSLFSEERRGYGVSNVNDRLVLHYGASARLRYESEPGQGTTVSMRIPL